MQEFGKKAGIILGHVICIFIVIYCFANTKEVFPGEEKEMHTVIRPSNSSELVEETITPSPTELLLPETVIPENNTITPEPEATDFPEPTQLPTPTAEPTEAPEVSPTPTPTPAATPMPEPTVVISIDPLEERNAIKQQVLQNIAEGTYAELDNNNDSWWFRRKENHVPSGTGELFDISEYQGFYLNENAIEEDKVIYLTIDCGYGSSNTAVLMDIFKKQEVKVTFFVTNFFLEANPEDVRRMVEEGHTVGNHSVSHADLTSMTEEEIYKEIIECEETFFEITGAQMDLYFRPPTGAYSKRTMQLTEDLGYKSIFWSIAYNDYDKNNQPGKDYVIDHFETYHHNGAIALMHNDSDSNMEAMEEVISLLKAQGYRFGTLDELK